MCFCQHREKHSVEMSEKQFFLSRHQGNPSSAGLPPHWTEQGEEPLILHCQMSSYSPGLGLGLGTSLSPAVLDPRDKRGASGAWWGRGARPILASSCVC